MTGSEGTPFPSGSLDHDRMKASRKLEKKRQNVGTKSLSRGTGDLEKPPLESVRRGSRHREKLPLDPLSAVPSPQYKRPWGGPKARSEDPLDKTRKARAALSLASRFESEESDRASSPSIGSPDVDVSQKVVTVKKEEVLVKNEDGILQDAELRGGVNEFGVGEAWGAGYLAEIKAEVKTEFKTEFKAEFKLPSKFEQVGSKGRAPKAHSDTSLAGFAYGLSLGEDEGTCEQRIKAEPMVLGTPSKALSPGANRHPPLVASAASTEEIDELRLSSATLPSVSSKPGSTVLGPGDIPEAWKQDPVFLGMEYAGCTHKYSAQHFERFLQLQATRAGGGPGVTAGSWRPCA